MAQNNQSIAVTVIGLGKMGTAIAKTLLKENFRVITWNRTKEKSLTLQTEGAVHAETIQQAIAGSEIVFLSLLDYATVNTLLRPLIKLVAGKTIINLINGSPVQATETAGYLSSAGAQYLDGGIMAVPAMLGQKSALLLFSGSKPAFNDNTGILAKLGTVEFLDEDPSRAALYDLALLSAMYGMYSGYLQSIALVNSAGIKAVNFTPMVVRWLQVMTQSLSKMGEAIDTQIYTDNVASNLDMQTVSFVNLIDTYEMLGIPVDLVEPLHRHMEDAVAKGYGSANFSALFESIKGKKTGEINY